MKSKKLFAILTLVAFMMTLVPMAAFGAATMYASAAKYEETSAVADGSSKVDVTVTAASGSSISVGDWVYAVSSRGTTDTFALDAEHNTAWQSNSSGEVVFSITSSTVGTPTIATFLYDASLGMTAAQYQTAVFNYLNGKDTYTKAELKIISEQVVTFTSPAAGKVTLIDATGNADGTEMEITAVVYANAAETAVVRDSTVEFFVNKTGLTFSVTSATTDALGRAKTKISTSTAGDYTVTARCGSYEDTEVYTFNTNATPYSITLYGGDAQITAKGLASSWLKVQLFDLNGNKMTDANGDGNETEGVVDWSVQTKPSGSSAGDNSFSSEAWDTATKFIKAKFTPDVEGDYVLRAKLDNGRYVDFKMTSKTQGAIVKMTLAYDEPSLPLQIGADTQAAGPTIKYLDAAGVSSSATASSLQWATSNATVLGCVNGVISVKVDDEKYMGEYTITAIDESRNLTASTKISVNGAPVALKLTADKALYAVGDSASVSVAVIDSKGNTVALGTDANPTVSNTVTTKDLAAYVSASTAGDKVETLRETGKTTVTVKSTKEGAVELTVRVADGASNYIGSVTLNFGAAKATVGAKSITMFIGSKGFTKDGAAAVCLVAPFVSADGRTMVGVRDVAGAFGVAAADIGFANGVVTLKRSDVTVTITIGSKDIKTSAGKTITSDVAAYVTADGRTVLPIRFIAEAFGYTATYDAATQSVVFAQ